MRRLYGAGPLHLVGMLGLLVLTGYAGTRVLADGSPLTGVVIWFIGAAIAHDALLLPVYAIVDVLAQGRVVRRRRALPAVRGVPMINHLRVPVAFSALLMLIWFPLILGGRSEAFLGATGLTTDVYAVRWLVVTGALFVGSALIYAARVLRVSAPAPTVPAG